MSPFLKRLASLEFGISLYSYSLLPSNFIGGGGGCSLCGKGFGKAGSSWETWKTGCTPWNCCGRRTVMECMPRVPIISNGPRFFSAGFLEGQVVWKNFVFTYTQSPILHPADVTPRLSPASPYHPPSSSIYALILHS